ncbi:uncharacterized protein F5Z01DRAFT_634445 [Emericellopsis atlantica]|uniref:Uncharacterized protein n=1 Tax=Emericellopsis atlantica TaxID=2614577 RepID=A0A9P7ZS74_9HYPO|nr:uncharacterized protein F5Z01DRAFT_634445 [Emericellopsis atlantica]KAG9256882.1 hypothetical protein F5Z01DRAFT_634445 [Emericellopsis atlantica]
MSNAMNNLSQSNPKQVEMQAGEEVGQKAVHALQITNTEWTFWLPTLEEVYEECSFDTTSLRKENYEEILSRHAAPGGVDGMYVYDRPRSRLTAEGEKGSMMINYYKDESSKTMKIVAVRMGLYQKDDSNKFRAATRTSIRWAASETADYSTFMDVEIIGGRHSVARWPKAAYKCAPDDYPISTLELSQSIRQKQKHAYRHAQNSDVAKELEENEQYLLVSHRRNKILAEQLAESKKKTSEANELKKKHNATNTKLRAENKDLKAQLQKHLNNSNDVERLRDELLGTQEAFDELKRQYNELLELDDLP